MFEFLITDEFIKSLQKIDHTDQLSIKNKLKSLKESENPLLFSTKLKGYKDLFRFRIGNYRAVFRLDKNRLIFLLIKHRKDVYRGL